MLIKKIFLITFIVISLFSLYSCDNESSLTQSQYTPLPTENPDTVVSEYNSGVYFMQNYKANSYPLLRFEVAETIDTNSLPHILVKGTLFMYLNNQLVDSIPYGPNYQWPGVIKPQVYGGYLNSSHQYLIKIKNDRDEVYSCAQSRWYLIIGQSAIKLPKVMVKHQNGIYENHSANMDVARKSGNKVIFFGAYYCLRETFSVLDPNSLQFKNYSRLRSSCYESWQWE